MSGKLIILKVKNDGFYYDVQVRKDRQIISINFEENSDILWLHICTEKE